MVDQELEDVSSEAIAPLPIRALGTRQRCLELKNARLRRRAASGDLGVPRVTSPPRPTYPQRYTRNNSFLEGDQVRRGVVCGGRREGCGKVAFHCFSREFSNVTDVVGL